MERERLISTLSDSLGRNQLGSRREGLIAASKKKAPGRFRKRRAKVLKEM